MNDSEKRQSERVTPSQLRVDCQSEGNFLFESVSDISQHGIFIETSEPLPPGTEVSLQFAPADSETTLAVSGTVIWINENREGSKNPGMGIQFKSLREIDKEILTAMIRRLAVL